MIWSYLRTGCPCAIGATAILWPRITRARAVTPAADAPSGTGSTATTTLSLDDSRTVRGTLIDALGFARFSRLYTIFGPSPAATAYPRFQVGVICTSLMQTL